MMNRLFRNRNNNNDDDNEVIVAAVEGGGTSFVVAIARVDESYKKKKKHTPPTVLYQKEVDSSHDNPAQTLQECAAFLQHYKPKGGYHALGIASFGPVGLNPSDSQHYGRIGGTSPKASWRHVDLLTPLKEACEGTRTLAVQFETDVNAPALAEYLLVQDQLSSLAYVTVGTGVGVGLVIHGKPVHGRMHPEAGHLPVHPLPGDYFGGYSWGGKAPFHGKGTVEGMASSVALTERLQARTQQNSNNSSSNNNNNMDRSKLATLTDDDEIWDHAANAIATLCASLLLTTAVEKIVLGGGIMNRTILLPKIRHKTVELLNTYLPLPDDMSTLITTSTAHGSQVGLIGALVLAQHAYDESIASTKDRGVDSKKDTAFRVGMMHGVVVGAVAGAVGGVHFCRR